MDSPHDIPVVSLCSTTCLRHPGGVASLNHRFLLVHQSDPGGIAARPVPSSSSSSSSSYPAIAQAAPPQAALDESHRTFLREHCTACHNADKQKGKVRLDDIAFTLVTARTALVVLAFQKSQFQ